MKKILAVLLALLLALSLSAFAEEDASITAEDLATFEIEGSTGDDYFYIACDEDQQIAEEQLDLLTEEGVDAYFGEASEEAKAYLGKDALDVYEFLSVVAGNYKDEMGDVVVHMAFATPVAEGEKVAVLLGLPNGDVYDWSMLEGVGNAEGGVDVTVPGEICKAIEDEGAILALVG